MTAPCHLASQQYSKKPLEGRALWEFEFEEKNCCHVNFLGDGSAVQDEKGSWCAVPDPNECCPMPCLICFCVRDAPS